MRPYVAGKLIVVFGCGGDRDAGKRPIMGEIARRDSPIDVIVTDDNPRSRGAGARSASAILAGPPARSRKSRKSATGRAAICEAGIGRWAGDGLLIAGKGHETGQIIGDAILPFSDSECASQALKDAALKDAALKDNA